MADDVGLSVESVRADFDEIAQLADSPESATDVYAPFLLSLIPAAAARVLDVGCGLGGLAAALANDSRDVVAIDLSPRMLERARKATASKRVTFICGDFMAFDFRGQTFDCIVSAATLHHLPQEPALTRVASLLRPGGRLVLQDLRRDDNLLDTARACTVFSLMLMGRLARTGRLRNPRPLREAWARHGATERYLSIDEVQQLAVQVLPGARVINHWMWRYTIVWDKPAR